MEKVRCNLCGSARYSRLFSAPDHNHDAAGGRRFDYVKCLECGLVYQNPRVPLKQIGKFYPASYGKYRLARKGIGEGEREELEMFQLECVLAAAGKGRLLDVGAGEAGFLEKCAGAGFEAWGCELSGAGRRRAAKKGIRLFVGDFLKAPYKNGFFDVITMWHSLEHFADPKAAMAKVAKLLKPGGIAVVAVPNAEGLQARLFGRHWAHVDAPRHYYLFSPRTLAMLFEKSGLSPTATRHSARPYNLWGYGMSVLNAVGAREGATRKPSAALKAAGIAAFTIPVAFESAIGMGGTIVAYARRAG